MFDHRAHLAVAFDSLHRHGLSGALARVPERLKTLAEVHGSPGKYHETLTVTWLLVMADRMARSPEASLDELLEHHRELLDPGLVSKLYRPATLQSQTARSAFVFPDADSLPGFAALDPGDELGV